MKMSDKVKEIRMRLKKELNYSNRQVSVKKDNNSIVVTVKIPVDIRPIKKIVKAYEKVDRCERSGEILCGGNIFVFVEYSWEMIKEESKKFLDEALKAIEASNNIDINQSAMFAENDKIRVFINGDQTRREIWVAEIDVNQALDCFAGYNEHAIAESLVKIAARWGELKFLKK